MPKVSIIVPVYCVEAYLDKCIGSLLGQTFSDLELILVDDGSPDRCGEICDEWAKKDDRVRVFHKPNGGLSDARNYGIERAEGAYLTFVDSDDYVKPTYLSYLLSLFDAAPEAALTACNHLVVRGEGEEKNSTYEGVRVLSRREAFEEVLYHGVIDVSAWAKLYRREAFAGIRYPVGHLYEDTYVFGEVLNGAETVVYGGEPQYYYVQRQNSIVNGAFTEKRMDFVRSVERLTAAALACDPALEGACLRRETHARLSVLRYMEKCEKQYRLLRKSLRDEVLAHGKTVLNDPRTPKRDRLAIKLLRLGLGVFYLAWRLYERTR